MLNRLKLMTLRLGVVKTPLKSSHIQREMLKNANFSYGYHASLAVQVLVPLPRRCGLHIVRSDFLCFA